MSPEALPISSIIYGFTQSAVAVMAAAGVLEAGKRPFDLFGSEDLTGVISSADRRRQIAAKTNPGYAQQRVDGADHFFEGEEEDLLRQVSVWLAAQSAAAR